jgi:hypothetical protein
VDPNPWLDFAFAEIVQVRLPMRVLLEISGRTLGQQYVPGVAAIHHALCHTHARAGDVRHLVNVNYTADRTTMDPHAKGKLRVIFKSPTYFQRTFDWRLRTAEKNQRHAVTGWNSDQPAGGFLALKLIRTPNNLVEQLEQGALLINQ